MAVAVLAASLVAALVAASPVLAPDGCTGVSAALAAHHCASLRDLFTRAAIVNCSSDPCGCWCSRDDDADQLCRANRRSCALCENLCALPPRAADARGEALRRLEFSYAFSANPIDRSGHHEHHEKHWWEPYCAPSSLNMARRLPAYPTAQRMTHCGPLYRRSLQDGSGHPQAVPDPAWSVWRSRIDNCPHCLRLAEGLADVSQLVRAAMRPRGNGEPLRETVRFLETLGETDAMWPDVRPCVTCVRVHDRSRPYVATLGPMASRLAVVVRIPHTHYETQRARARARWPFCMNERREERVFQSRGSTCLEFINFAFGDRIRVGRSARAHTRGAAKSRYTFYKCKSLRHI